MIVSYAGYIEMCPNSKLGPALFFLTTGNTVEPLKHFRNLPEPIGSQGSQGKLKGVNMLGTNRTERKEKSKKTLRYQGNSMEPPGNP